MVNALNINLTIHWMNVSVIWGGLGSCVHWTADVITTVHVRLVLECVTVVKVRKQSLERRISLSISLYN
jgi:hypothetical protein